MTQISGVVITKGGHEHVIDCIKSVDPWVDEWVVLDNGMSLEEQQAVYEAIGVKPLHWHIYKWPNDFAKAKNDALSHVLTEWALIMDDDYEFTFDFESKDAFKSWLAEQKVGIVHVWGDGYYSGRLVRRDIEWKGIVHEYPTDPKNRGTTYVKLVSFKERPRTPEQSSAKFLRDRDLLERARIDDPDNPRWMYYLGATYEALGFDDSALACYIQAMDNSRWDEEIGWSAFKAACICAKREQYDDAIELCMKAAGRHAGMAELFWMASWCNYRLGRNVQACRLANMAIAANSFTSKRIGFRFVPALYEAPYNVLRYASSDEKERKEADQMYRKNLSKRLGFLPPPTGLPVTTQEP